MRLWVLWGLVLMAGCAPRLVQEVSPEHPRWDVPFGKPFPKGTRGMVVARDTLWVGPLVAREGGLQVADRTFALSEVDCVAYRLPRSYMPWPIGAQSLATIALGAGVAFLGIAGSLMAPSCEPEPSFPADSTTDLLDPWIGVGVGLIAGIEAIACVTAASLYLAGTMLTMGIGGVLIAWGITYPEHRLQKALHRYTLRRDPVWRDRCAEILHFYHPLLEEDHHRLLLRKGRDFQAIPLNF